MIVDRSLCQSVLAVMSTTSRNVLICKLVRCSQAFAQGLWNNGVLSPYLFILTHNSKTVRSCLNAWTSSALSLLCVRGDKRLLGRAHAKFSERWQKQAGTMGSA